MKRITVVFTFSILLFSCSKEVDYSCNGGGDVGDLCKEIRYYDGKLEQVVEYNYNQEGVVESSLFKNADEQEIGRKVRSYDDQNRLVAMNYTNGDKELIKTEEWKYEGDLLQTYQVLDFDIVNTYDYTYQNTGGYDLVASEKYYTGGILRGVKLFVYVESDTAVHRIDFLDEYEEENGFALCTWFGSNTYKKEFFNQQGELLNYEVNLFEGDQQLKNHRKYDLQGKLIYEAEYFNEGGVLQQLLVTQENQSGSRTEYIYVE